jgi:Domain of unknown function (DUF6933)
MRRPCYRSWSPWSTLFARFTAALGDVLAAHNAAAGYVTPEASEMDQFRLAKTVNRSVVGIMNELSSWPTPTPRGSISPTCTPCRYGWRKLRAGRSTSGTSAPTENSPPLAQHPTT